MLGSSLRFSMLRPSVSGLASRNDCYRVSASRPQYERYVSDFRSIENILDELFAFQMVEINGERTIGKQDAFRVFLERNAQLLKTDGWTGVVVPSAFHANEGATGVRRLYLEKLNLRHCYSFENQRKLFEIDSTLQVRDGRRSGGTTNGLRFLCLLFARRRMAFQ